MLIVLCFVPSLALRCKMKFGPMFSALLRTIALCSLFQLKGELDGVRVYTKLSA